MVMKLELVLGPDNLPELVPDDFFYRNGWKVLDWLKLADLDEGPNHQAKELAERCAAYAKAYAMFAEASAKTYKTGDPLRHEPWVIPEYDSVENRERYLFIFKADNNGNTYRVRYEDCR